MSVHSDLLFKHGGIVFWTSCCACTVMWLLLSGCMGKHDLFYVPGILEIPVWNIASSALSLPCACHPPFSESSTCLCPAHTLCSPLDLCFAQNWLSVRHLHSLSPWGLILASFAVWFPFYSHSLPLPRHHVSFYCVFVGTKSVLVEEKLLQISTHLSNLTMNNCCCLLLVLA